MTDATARLTELFGIRHPIVLGPFGGLSSVELGPGSREWAEFMRRSA